MSLATAVADLDVSPRVAVYLRALGVTTVGELLALPSLVGEPRVLEELHSLFDELDVAYGGDFVLVAGPPPVRATGTVRERWSAIRAWLAAEYPARLAEFRQPPSAEAIRAAESMLAVQFPAEYREFMALHDGQEPGAPMVESATLMPLDEVVRRQRILKELFPQSAPIPSEQVDAGIRAVEHSSAWIPIGVSARGRDVLCLDLDPAEGGSYGQVILIVLDDDERTRVAPGFADLLGRYFEEAQTGEIDLERD